MSITSLADLRSAAKQTVWIQKSYGTGLFISLFWASHWKANGTPAAGSNLSGGNTANGIVPDNTTTGAASISAFSGSGYISKARISINDAGSVHEYKVYDLLFAAGVYNNGAGTTTLTSQPSFSARLPTVGGNPDYTGLELWGYSNGGWSGGAGCPITVTYTDQDGNTGHSTSITSGGQNTSPVMMFEIPLAAGDVGIQKVESVNVATATNVSAGVCVLRPLLHFPNLPSAGQINKTLTFDQIGMPRFFQSSCLLTMFRGTGGTNDSTGMNLEIEVASK